MRKSISIEDQKSQEKLLIAVENDEDEDNLKTWKTGGKVPMTLTETINNQKVSIDWHGKCSI